jgi:putative hemin transport protein
MLDRLASDDQTPGLVTTPQPPTPSPAPDDMIDIAALRTDWLALKDTHDFFALLRRHGVDRVQAFRLIGDDLAARAEVVAADQLLERVAAEGLPIMVFTGNPGCIQIHTGTVQRVMRAGPWQNVLDPDFNLHLDTTRVAHAFVVRKPSVDGTITSLELFDSVGRQIVTFFGKRKPGEPERPDWRSLVEGLAA